MATDGGGTRGDAEMRRGDLTADTGQLRRQLSGDSELRP